MRDKEIREIHNEGERLERYTMRDKEIREIHNERGRDQIDTK